MISYFVKRKRGVITVFTSIILIVVLSFSSLMMEIGRKRSIDAYFQEVVEKSAFATLSGYDRNLYKRFALLAMNPQVDEDTLNNLFQNYMKSNLNYELKDNGVTPITLDQTVVFSESSVEGIYDLADIDVLKSQIEEVSKYRSPYSLVENSLNLESSLKDFVKSIEKTIPMISYLKEATEIGKVITDVTYKALELKVATDTLDTAQQEYADEISNYNDAVELYNDSVAALDTNADDYEQQLSELKSSMQSSAESLKEKINSYVSAVTGYLAAITSFENAFNQMVTDGVVTALRIRTKQEMDQVEAANNQNNLGVTGYSNWSQMERDEYDKFLTKIYNADGSTQLQTVFQNVKDGLKSIKEASYVQLQEDLRAQRDSIPDDNWTEVTEVERESKWYDQLIGLIEIAITFITVVDKLVQLFEGIIEAYKSMADILTSVKLIKGALLPADDLYNDSISSVYSSLPSNNQSTSSPTNVVNDQSTVEQQLNRTNVIAQKVGFNLDTVNPRNSGANSEFYDATHNLMTSYARFYEAEDSFRVACSNFDIIGVITGLVEWIMGTIGLISAIINFLTKMRSIGDFLDIVYSKAVIADYSARMFPNRTSDVYTGVSLLGDKWSTYSAYWSDTNIFSCKGTVDSDNFSLARGEYIYGGSTSESVNQEKMYESLFAVKAVLNIVPIVVSESAMKILEEVFSIPYVGWLLAILLFIGMVMAETYIDLAFIIGGAKKLPIIKLQSWLFSKEGLKKLANNLKGVLQSENAKSLMTQCIDEYRNEMDAYGLGNDPNPSGSDPGGSNDKGYLENHGISFNTKIGYWGYTDYLMLFIVLQPMQTTLKRTADLIQLEMNACAKKQGNAGYDLSKAYTYIRVKAKGTYEPVLPIPSIPGSKTFSLEQLYYAGY